MIEVNNLNFSYDGKTNIFERLNLTLSGGQIYGLLGLNGAGKSTFLQILQGLQYPKSGELRVLGLNPSGRSTTFYEQSFLLPEEVFTPPIDINTFINRYAQFYPKFSLEDFLKFLNEFEIERKSNFSKMSMGQKKKVMIAFGLASNTEILLMDEPTNGLDIPSKKQFRKILTHILTEDRLFIISTHQIRDLHSLIDSVIVINEGKIIFNHTIQSICSNFSFSLDPEPITHPDVLYSERVPGGHLNIYRYNDQFHFEPDLEVLFNAIVTDNLKIRRTIN